ncbi:lysine methyltransferase [Pseudonocardia sediminis]|uniref:Lysine methyltransferase n=1 Tax=Pseudonocardia sediminis TaxID=1397368 RepID=A0A4Q7UWP6_PSEST|nr:methyltransferase domain-containing protein [Pseudonocardia sediminis]RZT86392.1 lysine methyltransferase [Pseudonocardia sediminis]
MRPADPSLVDAIVRAAGRDVDDPLLDVVAEPVDLPGGVVSLLRPHDPDALPFETVSSPDAEVEELHPPHWARLWPSGTALARAVNAPPASGGTRPGGSGAGDVPLGGDVGRERSDPRGPARIVVGGRSVLELGCGLGLPSLAAARAGGRVLATDRSPGAAAFVAATATRAGIGLRAASCAWNEPENLLAGGPWDVVLAADVLYGADALTLLADLLPRLTGDDGEVWLADPRRPLAPEFLADARARWREVDTVDSTEPGVLLHRLRGPARPFV